MNLIVLAAGKGSRLGHLTKKIPKVLMPLWKNKTILDYHLHNANAVSGIGHTFIISGFGDDLIKKFIETREATDQVDIIFNPFFGFSGPLGSLWMVGEKFISQDFIICNGDTYFSKDFLFHLSQIQEQGIYLGIDRGKDFNEDDMKITQESGKIMEASKAIDFDKADGVSSGMLLVKGEKYRLEFYTALSALVHEESNVKNNTPWHQLINRLKGMVNAVDMTGIAWHEVDTPADLKSLVRMLDNCENTYENSLRK